MKKITFLFVSVITAVLLLAGATSVSAAEARTNVQFTSTATRNFDVYPYLSANKRWLFLDISTRSLASYERFYYNVNYDTDGHLTLRGAEGFVFPVSSEFKYYNGVPYVRKAILLGSCSKNVCKYDSNPRKFRVTVNAKMKGAKSEVSKMITFN